MWCPGCGEHAVLPAGQLGFLTCSKCGWRGDVVKMALLQQARKERGEPDWRDKVLTRWADEERYHVATERRAREEAEAERRQHRKAFRDGKV